ncbi:MAG: hypothetical protein ABIG93_03430 [archaeon]
MFIEKKKRNGTVLILLIITLTICTLISLPLVSAGILEGELIDSQDNTITLNFDDDTYSYADGTNTNPNILLYINSDNPANDFQNHFFIFTYQVQNLAIPITVTKMFVDNANNPLQLDLDLSTGKAFYPGIVTVGISESSDFSPAVTVYYSLNTTTGLLGGSYGLSVSDNGNTVEVTIDNVTDSDGNLINTVRNYIIIGIKNETATASQVFDSEITYPGEQVTLAHPGDDFDFIVNGLLITDYNEVTTPTPAGTTPGGGGGGAVRECNDNQDNDLDGLADYPDDPGCESYYDDDEADASIPDVSSLEAWYQGEFGPEGEINEIVSPDLCVVCDWPDEPGLQIPRTFWETLIENYIYIILGVLTLVLLGLLAKLMYKHDEAKKIEKNLEELNEHITSERVAGKSDKLIKRDLIKAGWTENVLEEFMKNHPKKK